MNDFEEPLKETEPVGSLLPLPGKEDTQRFLVVSLRLSAW